MIKLATPTQYEQSIGVFNEIRPLKLADECKTHIVYPVCNVKSDDKNSSAIGKLARCSGAGSLLKSKNVYYDNYERIALTFLAGIPKQSLTFAQKVFTVFAVTGYANYVASTWWTSPDYVEHYLPVDYNLDVILPFVGYTMYFSSNALAGDVHGINFYGFY